MMEQFEQHVSEKLQDDITGSTSEIWAVKSSGANRDVVKLKGHGELICPTKTKMSSHSRREDMFHGSYRTIRVTQTETQVCNKILEADGL